MPTFVQHVVRFAAHNDIHPLSIDLFMSIVRRLQLSSERELLVAFFTAVKFEEIYPLSWDDVANALGLHDFLKQEMIQRERTMLLRLGFILPYRTTLRSWINSYSADAPMPLSVKYFMYAILYAGIGNLYSGQQWYDIYHCAFTQQPVPLQLVSLLSTKRVMSATPFTAFPKRLKRKLEALPPP